MKSKVLPLGIIIGVCCLFFYKFFLFGKIPMPADLVVGAYLPWLDYNWGYTTGVPVKNPIMSDVVSFIYPMQMLAIDILKSGHVPLWNRFILGGVPLLANFQSAGYSPTIFLYFIFDKLTAWSLQIWLQHVLAAFFTYILLRYWKVSKLGAVFGSLIYAFSGFNTIWSLYNGHVLASAFVPLILLFEDRWLVQGKTIHGAFISIAILFLLLSGYPQIFIYLIFPMGIIWLTRIRNTSRKLIKTLGLSIFILLGIGLAGFQILPGIELLSSSQRQVEAHPYEWAFLPWSKIITFIAPDYFGNHATGNYWGPQDYTSNTGYVGIVAICMALLAIPFIQKRREVLIAVLFLVASLLLALPTPISIYLWQSGFLGLNAASAHRALFIFDLGIAILAGIGLDYFKKSIWVFLPIIMLLGFGINAFTKGQLGNELKFGSFIFNNIPQYDVALRNLIFPGTLFIVVIIILFFFPKKILIFLLMIFELLRFSLKFTPFSLRSIIFPSTPVLDFLSNKSEIFRTTGSHITPENFRMLYKTESVEGYDAVYPLRTAKFISVINSDSYFGSSVRRFGTVDNLSSRLLDLANTKYFMVAGNQIWSKDKKFEPVFKDKSVSILENKNALPRAFMVFDWESDLNDQSVFRKLLDPLFPMNHKIIINDIVMNPSSAKGKWKLNYLSYTDQKSIIEVETDELGFLFISDTWFPGWKATIDGNTTKMYRADYTFRAIYIPRGTHEVIMEYIPDSFINGLRLSFVSLITILFIILFWRNKK